MPSYTIMRPSGWDKWALANQIEDSAIAQSLAALYVNSTIYERLDNLISLYEACKAHCPVHEKITELQQAAANFIEIIGNSPEVEETIAKRKAMRETWPTYLPNIALQYVRPFRAEQTRKEKIDQRIVDHLRALGRGDLLDVNPTDKKGDREVGVKMLNALEKEAYRIMPSDGGLWQLQQPQDDETDLSIAPFDTANLHAHHNEGGHAIFVLTPQGEMFAGSSEMDKFHHSSFQSGGYVAYGGAIAVKEGLLSYVDDYSGHYGPQAKQFFNVLKELKSHNLVRPETEIHKKFDESIGVKVSGNSLLNTRGFLGLPPLNVPKEPEKIDHYQIVTEFLMNNSTGEEDPVWRVLAVVMGEHLSNSLASGEDQTLQAHYEEIVGLQGALGIESGFAQQHPEEFERYVNELKELIEVSKGLKADLGNSIDWLLLESPEQRQELQQ